jgi:uncharacterized protein (TIGR03086 family)
MNTIESYQRAQDCFDTVLVAVAPQQWEAPSVCPEWTVRDIAGHVSWAQDQLRHWATGQDFTDATGAPGAPHPAEVAGADPVATWRAARERCVATLTDDALSRMIPLPGIGEVPVEAMVVAFVTDHLAHAWDIGHAIGLAVPLDRELVAGSFAWARERIVRAPGFFGPALTAPPDADEETRWLAFLGRVSWQPIPV